VPVAARGGDRPGAIAVGPAPGGGKVAERGRGDGSRDAAEALVVLIGAAGAPADGGGGLPSIVSARFAGGRLTAGTPSTVCRGFGGGGGAVRGTDPVPPVAVVERAGAAAAAAGAPGGAAAGPLVAAAGPLVAAAGPLVAGRVAAIAPSLLCSGVGPAGLLGSSATVLQTRDYRSKRACPTRRAVAAAD
jgi:hypothetical protein